MSSSQSRPSGSGKNTLSKQKEAVIEVLTPAVEAQGFFLEDVDLRAVGRRLVLRILIDTESGVNLDDVANASRLISDVMDEKDPFDDEPYTLEVSSPGVDRPLTMPRHWTRNLGRLVAVTLTNSKQLTGRILSIDDGAVVLEFDNKGRKSTQQIALADISKAIVQIEFSRVESAELVPLAGAEDSDDHDGSEHETDEHETDEHETEGESDAADLAADDEEEV
jgi:ribosome maturation factor RimP